MKKISTSLVFFVMRRPKATKRVINVLKNFKFKKVYIICDSWRNESEKSKVLKVRKIVSKSFQNQKIKKLFYDKNIGMRNIAPVAFKEIFKFEDKIIVIEDDTIPSPSFFNFADKLLLKYKKNKKISMISAVNFNTKMTKEIKEDYFFSRYSFLWGWATWRDRWKIYDNSLKKWDFYKKSGRLKKDFPIKGEYRFWKKELNSLQRNQSKGAWDFPLSFANYYYNRFSIVPKVNLVKNIGLSDDPTGLNPKKIKKLKIHYIKDKIIHPKKILRNLEYDNYCGHYHYYLGTFFVRLKNKVCKYLKILKFL